MRTHTHNEIQAKLNFFVVVCRVTLEVILSVFVRRKFQTTAVATDIGHPYWIYIIPTHDMYQWLLLQFLVLLMIDAESVRNM